MRYTLTLALILSVATAPAWPADTPASAPAGAKVDDVLKRIPADCLGFVLINDVKGTATAVDQFLLNIGVSGFLKNQMPKGLLAHVKEKLALGEGFVGDGPLAVFVVAGEDFLKTGIASLQEDSRPEIGKDISVVMICPGKDVQAAFPDLPFEKDGGFLRMKDVPLPMVNIFAAQQGDFIFLGTDKPSIEAALKRAKGIDAVLTKDQLAFVRRNNISGYVNLKPLRPGLLELIRKEALKKPLAAAADGGEPATQRANAAKMQEQILRLVTEWLDSLDTAMAGLQLSTEGIIAELAVGYNPASDAAKELAAVKPGKLLDKLPAGPYVLAGSTSLPYPHAASFGGQALTRKQMRELVSILWKEAPPAYIDPRTGAPEVVGALEKLAGAFDENYQGHQAALYSAQEGMFSGVLVLEVKDSKQMLDACKGLLAAGQKELAKHADAISLTLSPLTDGVEVLKLEVPEWKDHEQVRGRIKTVLGEEQIRIYLARPDDKTLVFTFGGGKDFVDQCVQAAREGGGLAKDAHIAAALKKLPPGLASVSLLNGGNAFDLVMKVLELIGGKKAPLALTQVPIAGGTAFSDNTLRSAIFVPNTLIKQSVSSVMMLILANRDMASPLQGLPLDKLFGHKAPSSRPTEE